MHSSTTLSDLDLWQREAFPSRARAKVLKQGRFDELYARYGPVIYARCRRMLRDPSAAEDAAQETFLRVYRHIDTAPTCESAMRWISRIATNYCLNMLRDRRLHAIQTWNETAAIDWNTGEDRHADRELARRLVIAAPDRIRAVSWLHHVDGLDQEEVARVLQVSRRTVTNYLGSFERFARKFLARSGGGAATTRTAPRVQARGAGALLNPEPDLT
jgi:RNA polymerase sigma-70 factor (ECF subfamily)